MRIISKLKWLYWNFFYRLYRWSEKVNGKYEQHDINAAVMLSGLFVLTFLAICTVYIAIFRETSVLSGISKTYALVAVALVISLNCFFICYKGKYKKIIKSFSGETLSEQKRNNFLVVIYGISVFILSVGIWIGWALFKIFTL